MEVKVAKLEAHLEQMEREIKEIKDGGARHDEVLEKILNYQTNIAVLTEQIKSLTEGIKGMDMRLKQLEDKPRRYVETVCAALITGIMGYLLACFLG